MAAGIGAGDVAVWDTTSTTVDRWSQDPSYDLAAADTLVDGVLTVTGTAQITGGPGSCDAATVGTFAWHLGAAVVCDGSRWMRLSSTPVADGTGAASAGKSCRQIREDFPDLNVDGVYWLEGADGPLLAYCDMTGGGWALILKTAAGDDTFQYDSPHWENDASVLNEGSLDPSPGSAKLHAFNQLPFTELRGCVDNGGLRCMEHAFSSTQVRAVALFGGPMNALFGADPNAHAAEATAYRDRFYDLFEPSPVQDCLPKDLGFNVVAVENNRARWGFFLNVPGQGCQVLAGSDADGAIGWGISGQDAGATGAGFTNYFVNNTPNGGLEQSFDSWLWVR